MSKQNFGRPMFVFDYPNRAIVGSKTSIRKAGVPGSKEQAALLKLMRKEPGFAVVEKEYRANANKRTYEGLNLEFIKRYLSIQPNAEHLVDEYDAVVKTAVDTNRKVYPFVKKWFLDNFGTQDSPFNMAVAKEAIEKYDLSQAKKTA